MKIPETPTIQVPLLADYGAYPTQQRPGPIGDPRTLADCCWPLGSAPAPVPSVPPSPPATTPVVPVEPAEYFDLKSLALYSRIGIRTLRGYIHRKARPLPSYQIDKKIIVRKVEFDEWLANFRFTERADKIAQAVDEILSGLTTAPPQPDTRAHDAESVARGRHGAREDKRLRRVLGLRDLPGTPKSQTRRGSEGR